MLSPANKDKSTIIFDLDGTAIDSPQTQVPSPRLIKALNLAKDKHNLCAATGRVWSFAKPVLQALQLTDPCIVGAGTQICDPRTGDVLWQQDIDASKVKEVVEVIRQNIGFKLLYNDYDEETYFHGPSMPLDSALTRPLYFIGLIFVHEREASDLIKKFAHIEEITCTLALAQRAGYNDILITHENATKEHAIAKLLELMNVPKERTTGIGDGHNDIHLFQAVHHKVAMGNAVPELKDAADTVIDPVSRDGMAQYLEHLTQD